MKTNAQLLEENFFHQIKKKYIISEQQSNQLKSQLSNIEIENPQTKRKNSIFTVLANKNHPAYQYARKILQGLKDKLSPKKNIKEPDEMPKLTNLLNFDNSQNARDRDREAFRYTQELKRKLKNGSK
jgi:hypothetical protein